MTPKFYENHVVTGKLYRPVLHKKGKQWVVVGLSALLLAGLGEAANLQATHASADTVQSSRTVQNSASGVYNKLTASKPSANSANAKSTHNLGKSEDINTNVGVHKPINYPQSASNYNNQVSSSASDASAKASGIGADSTKASQFAQNNSGKVTSTDNNLINQINKDNTTAGTLNSQANNDLKNASTDLNNVNTEYKNFTNDDNTSSNEVTTNPTQSRQLHRQGEGYYNQAGSNVGSLSGLASDASKADVSMKGLFTQANQDLAQLKVGDAQANQANVTDIIDYQDSDGNTAGSAVFSGQPGSQITNNTIKQYLPSDYKLTNSDQTLNFGKSDATQDVDVDNTSNGDIDVHPNEVNVQGHINLNFKNSDGTITVVPLAYGFQTNDDAGNTNALQHINYSDRVSDPSKFSTNKDVFRLDNGTPLHASDFSFDAQDSGTPYDITVTPSDAQYQNESQHTIYKDMNLYFNAVTNGKNEPSETVKYVDNNGNVVSSDTIKGGAGSNIPMSDSRIKGNTPKGYDINGNNPKSIVMHKGATTIVHVSPASNEPATVDVKGKDGKDYGTKTINGTNGKDATPSDLNKLAPKGYHVDPSSKVVYGKNGKDGKSVQTITVEPNNEQEIVRYYYNQNGKNVFAGDDYFNGINGQSDDVTASNDKGLDSGYHLVNNDNKFTFNSDNNVKTVPVVPTQSNASDQVQFMDLSGNKIADKNGDKYLNMGKGNPSDALSTQNIANNLPAHYHLVDPNQVINHDGATHDVLIAPDQVQNTITYDEPNGKKVAVNVNGGYGKQGNANDNIPDGYHLAKGVNPAFKYGDKNSNLSFKVEPNETADTIIYVDDDNNANDGNVVGSYTTGGNPDDSSLTNSDAIAHNMPAGYQVDNKRQGNNTDLVYDGLSHVIYVNGTKAKNQSVAVKIQAKDANGNIIPTATKTINVPENGVVGDSYTINPTDPEIMGNNNVPAGDSPESEDYPLTGQIMPNGLSQKSVIWTYDAPKGDSHAVMVYYRTADGKTVNSGVINDSHVGDKGDVTQKVNVPEGYQVSSGQNTEYTIENKPQYLSVQVQGEPAKDIFNTNKTGLTPEQKQEIEDKLKVTVVGVYRNSTSQYEKTYQIKLDANKNNIGDTFYVSPDTYNAPGYQMDSNDKIVEDELTAQGTTPGQVTFIYNAQNKGVNVSYQYIDSKGNKHVVNGNQLVHGNTNSDITNKIQAPKGYHLVPGEHVHVPSDNNSTDDITVNLAGDKVVGRAKLYLIYKRGNQMTGDVKYLPISGSVGDSDIVVDPSIYGKVGYHMVNDSDWHIPFNNVSDIVATDHGDTFRYDPENTFVYSATPEDIQVVYHDTVSGKQIGSTQDLGAIGYEGQIMDLENTNSGNLNVDGKDYALRVPEGYHLAYTNNYLTISENDKKNGKEQVNQDHLPIMRLVLGIAEPNFPARKPASSANKPASKANVKPSSAVKPTSQGSKASSASVKPSSSANKPASKKANSQSVTPINPVKPVSGNTKPSSKASATIKPASKASAKPASKASASVAPAHKASASVAPKSASVVPSASAKPTSSAQSASGNSNSTANSLSDDINKKAQELNSLESAMDNGKVHFANPTSASTSSASNSSATSASAKSASSNSSVAPQSAQPSASDTSVLQPQPKQTNDNNKSANGNALAPVAQPEAQEAEPETEPVEEPEAQASDEPAEAESPVSDGNVASDDAEPVASDGVEPTASASTVPASANAGTKLPQTNEGSNFASATAIAMVLLSVGLAGADVERKHNE